VPSNHNDLRKASFGQPVETGQPGPSICERYRDLRISLCENIVAVEQWHRRRAAD
jgi:hypothetical protein